MGCSMREPSVLGWGYWHSRREQRCGVRRLQELPKPPIFRRLTSYVHPLLRKHKPSKRANCSSYLSREAPFTAASERAEP